MNPSAPPVPWAVLLLIISVAIAVIGAQWAVVQSLLKNLLSQFKADLGKLGGHLEKLDTDFRVSHDELLKMEGRLNLLERERLGLPTKLDVARGLGRVHRRVDQVENILMEHASCIPGARKIVRAPSDDVSHDGIQLTEGER